MALTHSSSKLNITINNAPCYNEKVTYPQTQKWHDCQLSTVNGVGDFVIFHEILKDDEIQKHCQAMEYIGQNSLDLYVTASQVDAKNQFCHEFNSSKDGLVILEDAIIRKEVNLIRVYQNLNFPSSLLTLLPKISDLKDDVKLRVSFFFHSLQSFLTMGHQIVAEILRNENLAEMGTDILYLMLNLRKVSTFAFQKLTDEFWIFNMEIWSITSASVFSDYMGFISMHFDLIPDWKLHYGPEFWLESIERYFNSQITTPCSPVEYVIHPKKKHLFNILSDSLKWNSVNPKNLCHFISTTLYTTIDSQYICDVLSWFHNIKDGSVEERELFNNFVSKTEGNLFYYLLGSENEHIRLLALEFLIKIMKDNATIGSPSSRSPSLKSPLRAQFFRTSLSSEIDLSFDLIVKRLKMGDSTTLTCRRLVSLAFDNPNIDKWMICIEPPPVTNMDYYLALFEILPDCPVSAEDLFVFASEISLRASSVNYDSFWIIFNHYQLLIPLIMKPLGIEQHYLAIEIIAKILFCRLRSDIDCKRELYLEIDDFIISTIKESILDKDVAGNRICHFLETIMSELKQYVFEPVLCVTFKFGLSMKRIFTSCRFFLLYFDDIFSLIEKENSEFIYHKSIPFESNFNLSVLVLNIYQQILNLPYSSHLQLRDTFIPIASFVKDVEELGIELGLSGFQTTKKSVWSQCISYLEDFLNKRSRSYFSSTSPDEIYHILGIIYECIICDYSESIGIGEQDVRVVISLFNHFLKKSNEIFGKNFPTDFEQTQASVAALFSEAYDSIFLPASRKKEEESMKMSRQESLAMKDRYQKRLASKVFHSDMLNKKSSDLLANINAKKKQLADVGRKVLSDHVQVQREEQSFAAAEIKRLFAKIFNNESINHWKLDMHENRLRMRKRLAPNNEFNDHSDASTKRDKVQMVRSDSNPILKVLNKHLEIFAAKKPSKLNIYHQFASNMRTESGDSIISDISLDTDDWNVIQNDEVKLQNATYMWDAEMICLMSSTQGKLYLTNQTIGFSSNEKADASSLNNFQSCLSLMDSIRCRRYKLRDTALEFFLKSGRSHLVNILGSSSLSGKKERSRILKTISSLKIPSLSFSTKSPMEIFSKTTLTEQWRNHKISNFEYIMKLNTISGRTYNDLTQYPIYPWVLRDYTSARIDLNDPGVYRDLSKPIGALDPKRLQQILERYRTFEDPTGFIKKFHYGSHYSSSASVLFYLLRLEPFTSLHIDLQGGKFDHPDRQFHSVASCWNSVLTSSGDFKELIPEFFYMPEFLLNENNFDLGQRQGGEVVDNVQLPPWATNVHEFIRINREALESEYVSENLHHWIDLIWGFRQRGEEAVRAHNVFYFLTYEDEINIDNIKDPIERRSIEDQINNFGQTPSQLLKKPHPKRLKRSDVIGSNIFEKYSQDKAFCEEIENAKHLILLPFLNSDYCSPIKTVPDLYSGKLIGIDEEMYAWVFSWKIAINNKFSLHKDKRTPKIPIYLPNLSSKSFIVNIRYQYVIVIGCPDRSFKIINNLDKKPTIVRSINEGHSDIITCAALSEDDKILVTGSLDSNICVWQLRSKGVVNLKYTIYGHRDPITNVGISKDNDLILSESKDGYIQLHSYMDENLIRAFNLPESLPISQLSITNNCDIVISTISKCSNTPKLSTLHLYSINGKLISRQDFGFEISNFRLSKDGAHMIINSSSGSLSIHNTHDFSHIRNLEEESNLRIANFILYPDEAFLHISRITTEGKSILVLVSTDQILGDDGI